MNRKRKIRQMRKDILRLGEITGERILREPGAPKKEWGYSLRAKVNGFTIYAPDDSKYEAYKACLDAAKWANTMEAKPIGKKEE